MQPKTKREAEEMILDAEWSAARHDREATAPITAIARRYHREDAATDRAEAARLRALLPTLPE